MFKLPSFCVVTGASQGLGREIALQIAEEYNKQGQSCDLVLTARNLKSLEETKTLISSRAPDVRVELVAGDMADMFSLSSLCSKIMDHVDTTKHKLGLLVNNAGSMNDFETPFLSHTPQQIQEYMGLNSTAMMVLTTSFVKAFPQPKHVYIVNITSLLARMYFPGFFLYSVGKLAREGFMRALAVECPRVRLLNYSPGPCDTEMSRGLPRDSEVVTSVTNVLTPAESIQKMVALLTKDEFENGCVIDFYDV